MSNRRFLCRLCDVVAGDRVAGGPNFRGPTKMGLVTAVRPSLRITGHIEIVTEQGIYSGPPWAEADTVRERAKGGA